tara:strand:- start:52 stop:558 length:507 start_codon:yes stop_codon:yes gene_type:complete
MPWNWRQQSSGFSVPVQGRGMFSNSGGKILSDDPTKIFAGSEKGPQFIGDPTGILMQEIKEKKEEAKKIPQKPDSSDSEWIKFWKEHLGDERKYQEELYKRGQILKGVKGIQQGMDKWQLGPARLAAETGNRMASQWGNIKVPNFVTSPAVPPNMVRSAYSFQDFLRV